MVVIHQMVLKPLKGLFGNLLYGIGIHHSVLRTVVKNNRDFQLPADIRSS
jgi:hypothetical protein